MIYRSHKLISFLQLIIEIIRNVDFFFPFYLREHCSEIAPHFVDAGFFLQFAVAPPMFSPRDSASLRGSFL